MLAGFLSPSCLGLVKKCAVFGVSVRCLEGVWEVSGGCLSDSGLWLEGMICKQFIYIPFDSFLLAACFTPTGIVWTKSAQILGVCGVSGRCLEGSGDCLG